MTKKFTFLFLFIPLINFAQLPVSKIVVFDLKKTSRSYAISNPVIIKTSGEYTNQPQFSPDGEKLYFVGNTKKNNKTDIYVYDFSKKRHHIKQLTKTKNESEYSPQISPEENLISCVRVEIDSTVQHFFHYNLKGKNPKNILPTLKTIGYYSWLGRNEFITFNVPEPFYLMHYMLQPFTADTLAENIGRCVLYTKNKNLITYVDKSDSSEWKIKKLNQKKFSRRKNLEQLAEDEIITTTIPGSEDYCFLPNGTILMGKEGKIYQKKQALNNPIHEWEVWADLSAYKISDFYRIVISPNYQKLAIVTFEGKKP